MLPALIGVAGLLLGLTLGLCIAEVPWNPLRRRPGTPAVKTDNAKHSPADAVTGSATRLGQSSDKLQNLLPTVEAKMVEQVEGLESRMAKVRVDELTGLPDRRAFDDDLCRRMAEWRRHGTPLCVVLMELDRFPEAQSSLGREAASGLLRSVAMLLSGSLREMDVVARFSRDQFAVILPATCGSNAVLAAKRVRAEVAAATFPTTGAMVCVTLSIGLSEAMPGDHATLLVERADAALDAARRAGGNCVYLQNGAAARSIPAFEPSGFLPQTLAD